MEERIIETTEVIIEEVAPKMTKRSTGKIAIITAAVTGITAGVVYVIKKVKAKKNSEVETNDSEDVVVEEEN